MLTFVITQQEWENLQRRIQNIERRVDILETGFREMIDNFKDVVKSEKEVIEQTKICVATEIMKLAESLEKAVSEEIDQKLNEKHYDEQKVEEEK